MTTRWQITKAVRASDLAAPSRLIMLTLADVAEVGTAEIPAKFTPSLTVLSAETGLARSTVKQHLAGLERDGWVVRTRPDAKAQWLGERTRYRLALPESMTGLGVGQEEAHLGQEMAQGGPAQSPGVGQETTLGRPPDGHLETDHSDQGQIPSDQPTPAAPEVVDAESVEIVETPNLPAVVSIPNAGQLTRAWIDHCASRDVKLPTSTIKRYGKHISDAMKQGFPVDLIKRALAQMLADGEASRPSLFDNYLVRAQSGPARGPRKLTPGEASVARLAQDPVVQAGIADMLANYGPKAEPA